MPFEIPIGNQLIMEWPDRQPTANMEESGLFKKQLSSVYLLISILYLATIFNFSLYLQLYNQFSSRGALSSQQVANQRLVDKRSIVTDKLSSHFWDGKFADQSGLDELPLDELRNELDALSVNKQNELNVDKAKERFKRSHQFDLADFDLSRVWLSEDESLKQKLTDDYRSDDESRPPVRRAKKVRSVNEDKLLSTSESPTLHPPPAASRSARHRSHHQKRRLTTTTTPTEQFADQDQQSAEFFSQPQPNTGHANGKVWVNSYSRIPVSHVLF